jgi:hypothetical protein
MQTSLENRKKAITDFPRIVLKMNNKVEEGGASGSRVKREQENTNLRAQKMMRGKVEPLGVPTVVRAMSLMV